MSKHVLSLTQRLHDLTSNGATPPAEAVGALVQDIVKAMKKGQSNAELALKQDFQEIVTYIRQTRNDIASIGGQADLPSAKDELEEVVAATESATGKILDAAEKISAVAAEVGGKHADALNDAVTKIYEASNFQDITGQRLTKVIKTLQKIENKISGIVGEDVANLAKNNNDLQNPDAPLMNGPQLPANATSQDDIDALFDSL